MHIWTWEDHNLNTVQDILAVGFGHVYHARLVPKPKVEEWRNAVEACTSHQEVVERFRTFKHALKSVPFETIMVAEHHPLLTIQHIRIHYETDGKRNYLSLKAPAISAGGATVELFEDLHRLIAPQSQILEEQMPRAVATRGPILSIVLGIVGFALLAYSSTATERTLSEELFASKWTIGSILRWVGPWGWSILGVIWVGASTLLLRARLKNPPTTRIWRRA